MYDSKILNRHVFNFSPEKNGGEVLTLTSTYHKFDADPGVFVSQEITLESYGNSASFNLYGISLTPKALRQLADELELAELVANQNKGE